MAVRVVAVAVLGLLVASCSDSAETASTNETAVRGAAEAPVIEGGPLSTIVDDEAYVISVFGAARPDESYATAVIYLRNRGSAPLRVEKMRAVEQDGIKIIAIGLVSATAIPPGTFREYPPNGVDVEAPPQIDPLTPSPTGGPDPTSEDALVVVGLRLDEGADIGSMSGVEITYSSAAQHYQEAFPAPTVLCTAPSTDEMCERSGREANDKWRRSIDAG